MVRPGRKPVIAYRTAGNPKVTPHAPRDARCGPEISGAWPAFLAPPGRELCHRFGTIDCSSAAALDHASNRASEYAHPNAVTPAVRAL